MSGDIRHGFVDEDKTARVTGPFTVESPSPHRSLAFAGSVEDANRETISQQDAAQDAGSPNFEQSIIDNLAKAGIQNGRRAERITFSSLDSYAGLHVQAVGERRGDEDDDHTVPARVGIAIGPQYGTVSPGFIKDAAREAIRAGDVDLLCILGFSFDPQATGVTQDDGVTVEVDDVGFANVTGERRMGAILVLLVRMNADLLMGEDLKKTGAGNLFTVFGEPDIELRDTAGGCPRYGHEGCGTSAYPEDGVEIGVDRLVLSSSGLVQPPEGLAPIGIALGWSRVRSSARASCQGLTLAFQWTCHGRWISA